MDSREFDIHDANGQPSDINQVVVPIIKGSDSSSITAVGTGFFVSSNGIFVSAKHVLMDAFDQHGNQKDFLHVIHFVGDNKMFIRPVIRFSAHDISDVAIGVCAPMKHVNTEKFLSNKVMTLCFDTPRPDIRIATYAFPRSTIIRGNPTNIHINPGYFDGVIKNYYPNGRDSYLLPGACVETTMHIHGGASGGPVFGPGGRVFGINSTGVDGTDISFVSLISCIKDMHILKTLNSMTRKNQGW